MPTLSISSVQLEWTEADGLVTVTPQDESRFNIKVSRAIEILQQADKQDQFSLQLGLLLRLLASWLKDRIDIRDAYVTIRDGGLAFVVVRTTNEYDEAFEDELSALDVATANDVDLDLIRLNVMALPDVSEEALKSFLDTSFVLKYVHGTRTRPHIAGQ